jgi:hypothetical protein
MVPFWRCTTRRRRAVSSPSVVLREMVSFDTTKTNSSAARTPTALAVHAHGHSGPFLIALLACLRQVRRARETETACLAQRLAPGDLLAPGALLALGLLSVPASPPAIPARAHTYDGASIEPTQCRPPCGTATRSVKCLCMRPVTTDKALRGCAARRPVRARQVAVTPSSDIIASTLTARSLAIFFRGPACT